MTGLSDSQRIDKWLWHARLVKSRTLAQKLVRNGKLRVNREKIDNPNHKIKVGNTLTIALNNEVKILEILQLVDRRGPYKNARLTYHDLAPAKPEKGGVFDNGSVMVGKRPAQRERKLAINLKQKTH